MPSLVVLRFFFLSLLAQALPQSVTPSSDTPRIHLKQDQLCCMVVNFVEPIYPREARLDHTEGVVKLILVIGVDGSIADLQVVSGHPLLIDSALKAVRQWQFAIGGFVGKPTEMEVPISFTFMIEDPPKPAYLHLTDGEVVRADAVREFTDRIEYRVGHHTHDISANSVAYINGCGSARVKPLKGCVLGGGPSFDIRATPLLQAVKTSHSSPASR